MATKVQVVFDCVDAGRLAGFWADVLRYKLDDPPPGYPTWEAFLEASNVPKEEWNSVSAIVDPDGVGPRIYFQKVPETKTVKNRLHLDVDASGGRGVPLATRKERVDAEVERILGLGATKVHGIDEAGGYFVVMRDVEGNEFCVH